jgi:hypothetical protein
MKRFQKLSFHMSIFNLHSNVPNPGLAQPEAPGRVRLLPDAKFPLRYRDLVGEYFRAVAESQKEGN